MVVRIVGENAEFDGAIDKSEKKFTNFAKKAERIGKNLTKFVTVPLVGMAVAMVKFAVDAEETAAKFGTAFRDVRKEADETAENLVNNFGLSTTEAQRLLSGTGDLLKGFGATGAQALELSNSVQELAVDLASYNNVQGGSTRASEILTKAMLGERDALTSLGIKVSEADLKQERLRRGTENLTGQAKLLSDAQITLALVTAQSGDALGDYERTSDSTANTMRRVTARAKDIAVEFGQVMLPAVNKALGGIERFITRIGALDERQKKIIVTIAAVAAGIGPLLLAIKALNAAITLLAANPIVAAIVIIGGLTVGVALLAAEMRKARSPAGQLADELARGAEEAQNQADAMDNLSEAMLRVVESEGFKGLFKSKEGGFGAIAPPTPPAPPPGGIPETIKLVEELAAKIANLDALQEAGGLTEIELLERKIELREDLIDDLIDEAEAGQLTADIVTAAIEKEIGLIEVYIGRLNELTDVQAKATTAQLTNATELIDEMDMVMLGVDRITQAEFNLAAAREKWAKKKKKDDEDAAARQRQEAADTFNIAGQLTGQLTGIWGQYYENKLGQVEQGSEEEKRILREQAISERNLAFVMSLINTAVAVTAALPNVPFAVATGILGAIQAALILGQPIPALATGGVVMPSPGGTIAQVAEAGQPEVIFPLDRLDEFLSNRPSVDAGMAGEGDIHLVVQMDSKPILDKIFPATKNRTVLIDARAVT